MGLAYSFVAIFFILFVVLTTTVFCLIQKLKSKNNELVTDDLAGEYFKKEINTLTIILIFFNMSYLLRVIYEVVVDTDSFTEIATFSKFMITVLTAVPFDLLPIYVVLLFHRRNLNQITRDGGGNI